MSDMNSGESYISNEENWWDDKPQSKASRILRWIFGIILVIVMEAAVLFMASMVGALVFLLVAQVVSADFALLAVTVGGLALIAVVLIGTYVVVELWHPLHNWIRHRMDVLVID